MRGDRVALLEEVALDLEHEARDGLGLSLDVVEERVLQSGYLREVADVGLALEEERVVAQAAVEGLLAVALVVDVADDLLQNVLQRQQSQRRAVFVHDDGHVYLVALELLEEVVDLLVFGYVVGGAQVFPPVEIAAFVDEVQHVFDVEDADDGVDVVAIDRYAREARLDDGAAHRVEVALDIHGRDVHAGTHDVLDVRIDEIDDAGQHLFLLLALVLGDLQRVGEFVDRDVGVFACGAFVEPVAQFDQHPCQRLEERLEAQQRYGNDAGEAQRQVRGGHLGDNLAEEQQDEGHQHGLHYKLPARGVERNECVENVVRQHDDQDVHQVVQDQNRGQHVVLRGEQLEDGVVAFAAPLLDGLDVGGRQGEECRLGTRCEGRDADQHEQYDEAHDERRLEPVVGEYVVR